ncbi:MAG TPA: iron ABC transporter permease [Streptosporangiaceae bacterium]
MTTLQQAQPTGRNGLPRRRRGRPLRRTWPLTGLATAAVGCVLAPVGFLVWQAALAGWAAVWHLLWRQLTLTLLVNTAELTVAATACAAAIAVGAAWCVERTDLPARRLWRILVMLPLAIPDFIVAYTWSSLAPAVHGLGGAVLVMTLGLYPLAYLPVAAALRRMDVSVYEVARSLGSRRITAFGRVVLPQLVPAVLGGSLLVALGILAEFGAFEILRFQTFTTEIFSEFQLGFDTQAASALSLVLVAAGLLVLAGERWANRAAGRGAAARQAAGATVRAAGVRRYRLGRGRGPALAGLAALAGLGVGVPVSTVAYWLSQPAGSTLPPIPLAGAAGHTLLFSIGAAALATVAAFPVALLSVRHPGRFSLLLERGGYLVQGLPGLVIALSLVFFTIHAAYPLYQSPELVVAGYAVMFFPLALVSLRVSLGQAPRRLTDTARSLGCRPVAAAARVTLPLAAPGIAAAAALVFLSAATELTATLVLVPAGSNTLATAFWAYQTDVSYAAAARYAALIVVFAVIPGAFLQRWFDPERAVRQGAT